MRTKMRLIVAPVALIFGIGAMVLTSEAQTSSRARDGDNDKRRCGRVFAINPKSELLRLDAKAQTRGRGDDDDDHERVRIKSRLPIYGLTLGEILVGIDFRPATGQLYGLGTPGGGPGAAQLYIIDTETAIAMKVGNPNAVLGGSSFGFDFNPVPDRIRVVSNLGQNLRLNPNDGTIAGMDTDLAYAAGDPNAGRMPSVVGAAYTNPDRDPQTNTVLYDIDSGRDADSAPGGGDVLAIQVPPNAGQLNTVGRLGINTDDIVGFDISHRNVALAALQEGQTSSRLVSIDLISGRATDRGRVGELLTGLAIELGPQCDASNSDRGDNDDNDR
jgi:Domain of unknown function (DUF4394)